MMDASRLAIPPTITSRILWKVTLLLGIVSLLGSSVSVIAHAMAFIDGIILTFTGIVVFLAVQMREGKLVLNPQKAFGIEFKKAEKPK